MSGAFDLSRMLKKQEKNEKVKRLTKFSSECEIDQLLDHLSTIFDELGIKYQVDEQNYVIKAVANTTKGALAFNVQLYVMTKELKMVDFARERGDLLDWHKLYRRIYEKCSDVVLQTEK
eukprot:TRINITY_DN971_c2_g1_i1.p1 TRINITY_DN971_c2_g1~~TRINITY_DN971_c2_g1_i1.p1  ORF type:complete len:119 (+),score=41.78 TRINITY_DN971_c2_g1_i1:1129-1485(+)